jgi:hypothetical protein
MTIKINQLFGFYKPKEGKFSPTYTDATHELAIIPNTSKRVNTAYALKYLNKGHDCHNKRLSALFLEVNNNQKKVYRGDFLNGGIKIRFRLIISKDSGFLKLEEI